MDTVAELCSSSALITTGPHFRVHLTINRPFPAIHLLIGRVCILLFMKTSEALGVSWPYRFGPHNDSCSFIPPLTSEEYVDIALPTRVNKAAGRPHPSSTISNAAALGTLSRAPRYESPF